MCSDTKKKSGQKIPFWGKEKIAFDDGGALSVMDVAKHYTLYQSPSDRIKDLFSFGIKRRRQEFWALQDITFSVPWGKCVGIIGENGSGKSTLLKIISGTLFPSSGTVKARGRVSSLLELGIGFNSELTGRENINLQGAILGYSKKEMIERAELIEDFADLGDFITQPVKCYSSGMHVRLGFACAIHTDPDILVIDEALAVGDMSFQRKCYAKIEEFLKRDKTFVFVSHNMDTINSLCDYALLLKHGRIEKEGAAKDVTDYYIRLVLNEPVRKQPEVQKTVRVIKEYTGIEEKQYEREMGDDESGRENTYRRKLRKDALNKFKQIRMMNPKIETRLGNKAAEIIDFGMIDDQGHKSTAVQTGQNCNFIIRALMFQDIEDVNVQLVIRNTLGISVFWTSTAVRKFFIPAQNKSDILECSFSVNLKLGRGKYFAGAMVMNQAKTVIYDYRLDTMEFEVFGGENLFGGDSLMNLDTDIKLKYIK
ncbi:MAG: ABC transporter ATP-binding protein [Bacteroidetes bacterium]|nr:ABC transporter ATP-binding protein [Bacteroidota bacterium]